MSVVEQSAPGLTWRQAWALVWALVAALVVWLFVAVWPDVARRRPHFEEGFHQFASSTA